jgi:hypothetical protein
MKEVENTAADDDGYDRIYQPRLCGALYNIVCRYFAYGSFVYKESVMASQVSSLCLEPPMFLVASTTLPRFD